MILGSCFARICSFLLSCDRFFLVVKIVGTKGQGQKGIVAKTISLIKHCISLFMLIHMFCNQEIYHAIFHYTQITSFKIYSYGLIRILSNSLKYPVGSY